MPKALIRQFPTECAYVRQRAEPASDGEAGDLLLTLYNSIGTLMSSNDSWSSATASVVKAADSSWSNKAAAVDEITEAGRSPTSSLESALWPILKSGIYTAELSGVSSGTGVGLPEIYEY